MELSPVFQNEIVERRNLTLTIPTKSISIITYPLFVTLVSNTKLNRRDRLKSAFIFYRLAYIVPSRHLLESTPGGVWLFLALLALT